MDDAGKKKAAAKKPAQAASNFTAWKPQSRRAKPVGEFVSSLMRPAFEKFGFSAGMLLTDWEAIAGKEMAAYTAPERLKWPRMTGGEDEARGATLLLRVAGARALEVEQCRGRLIERINIAFGYRAVSEIRVIQAPLPKRAPKRPPRAPISPNAAPPLVKDLPDGPLKLAFARMAAGISARTRETEPATP